MSSFWKSLFFIWFPVSFVLLITHNVLWGEYDYSSFYFGMAFVFLAQFLDIVFNLD